MPSDGAIQIAFDRYLLPATVNRQSFFLVDSANQALPGEFAPIVTYDPIARTVTLRPQKSLAPGQRYKVILGIPEGDSDVGGVRAIDRATLFRDQQLEFAFAVAGPALTPIEPTATFCRDVLPIFAAKCSIPTCHGTGESAAAGLILDTSAGVGATALNRIAQGSNTGGRSGLAPAAGRQFGVDMAIIAPGDPGNSWLLYKVELARPPVVVTDGTQFGCTNGLREAQTPFAFAPLAPAAQRAADDIEHSILSNFILGREMPFPLLGTPGGYGDTPLTFDEREKVRLWIQSLPPGGSVPECGGCGFIPPADAGSSEAGVFDSGIVDAADAGDSGDASDASTD